MDEQKFRDLATGEGYTVGDIAVKPANDSNDFHAHDFSAKLLVIDGEITVTTEDGKATTCRTNDVFQLAAGIRHKEQVGPDGVRYLAGRK